MVDWTKTKIRQALANAEPPIFNFRDLDKRANLAIGTTLNAILTPHKAGEQAIAETIGVHPLTIWPSRYNRDGTRKRPQPRENYTRGNQTGHVKNVDAA